VGNGSAIRVARPRWRLRENLPQKTICYGNQGSTCRPKVAVAECLVEHVIGSIRRELLDRVIVMGEAHLRQLLRAYADYYNTYRTHLGLDKDTPLGRPVQHRGRITPIPKLGGLHHAYVRI